MASAEGGKASEVRREREGRGPAGRRWRGGRVVGDKGTFHEGPRNGSCEAEGAVAQLCVNAVGLDQVAGDLDKQFAVLGRAYVVELEKATEIVSVGLNALCGGVIGTVIAVFVAGNMEAQSDHVVGYVSLNLGDVDGVRTFRAGTAYEEVP